LKALFHRMDDLLRDPQNAPELASLKNGAQPEDDGEESATQRRATAREALELFQRMMVTQSNRVSAAAADDAAEALSLDNTKKKDDKVVGSAGPTPSNAAASPSAAPVVVNGGRRHCELPDHPLQAGCTAVVVFARRTRLYCANAGDSRAVLSRRGLAVALSKDHKPNDEPEERRVLRAGGFVECANGFHRINGNLNLSRSIGDLKYKGNATLSPADQIITAEPDVVAVDLAEDDDFFVVACDGVFDVLTSQELVDFINERIHTMDLARICEAVFDRCIAQNPRETRGIGGDNMTCVIAKIHHNGLT